MKPQATQHFLVEGDRLAVSHLRPASPFARAVLGENE